MARERARFGIQPADSANNGPGKVAIVGTYVPRRCGIATFSSDLLTALRTGASETEWSAVAMNDTPEGYDYPPEVHFEVGQKVLADYRLAVDFLNMNQVEAVCLQHEFGIYGGNQGSYILRPLQNLRMPIITTLHTVLQEPRADQKEIITAIGQLSDRVVVMSRKARQILRKVYGIAGDRIAVIPHGVPDMPFLDASYHKDQFGMVGKKVILTFGLLSPGKGIEYVIEALPEIVAVHPDAIFVVIGATHPEVRRQEGEAYRLSLQQRARELGVDDHVVFHNQYIDTRTLTEFLSTADVFVTPYVNQEQIVSGVLSYALGAGKAAVSTPYWYAEEVLANGRGRLVPFRDAGAIGREVTDLLSNDVARDTIRKKAYTHARDMVWSKVAAQYLKLLAEVRDERDIGPRGIYQVRTLQANAFDLPQPDLSHIRVLTDDTGIFQHAEFAVPNRDHGYCTDDNARALIVSLMAQHVLPNGHEMIPLAYRYLSFLQHAFNVENGRLRNFMSYDRRWLEPAGSEDSHGRALWALGETVFDSPSEGMAGLAMALFDRALPPALEFTAMRPWAYSLIGINAYLARFGGASEVRRARAYLADKLFDRFKESAIDDWPWPEPIVTYANAAMPQALIASGAALDRPDMVESGLRTLRWLLKVQTDAKGHFIPIGNRGWFVRGEAPARFDQQPIEVQHMVDALVEAFEVTGDRQWLDEARRCFEWFLGRNDLQQPICDHSTGGGRDGLSADRVNPNQGAESTLAWLHSLMRLHMVAGASVAAEPQPVARIRPAPHLVSSSVPDRVVAVPH
jgi:glycosyltransferase involved in cell wall biosynthesis